MSKPPKSRIIVVEDEPITRKLLQRQLEQAGYEVVACPDGRAALQPISEMRTGIVLADWNMPQMDGIELCRAVRELERMQALGTIYFVLLSAYDKKEQVVEGLAAGANDYLTKPYHHAELLARLHVGQRMLQLQEELLHHTIEYHKANAQLALLAQKLDQQANTDGLTGFLNRRCLFKRFQELWELTDRQGQPLSCIMLDVDRFKKLNDTYGHAVGDRVLVNLTATIHRAAPRRELCGRIGGEEFVILCPGMELDGAAALAERVRQAVADHPTQSQEGAIAVTTSCGVAARSSEASCPDELIRNTDAALYAAKQNGRNQTWMHTGDGYVRACGDASEGSEALPADTVMGHSDRVRRKPRAEALESTHAPSDHKR